MSTSITKRHPYYENYLDRWRRNRDAVKGQDSIHEGRTLYLPNDNENNDNREPTKNTDADRVYNRYLARATWTPITAYTKQALIGAVFHKAGVAEVPQSVNYILENCDGAGNSLEQFSKHVIGELLEVGRVGVLAEYPQSDANLTAEAVQRLNLRPKLTIYEAETIDNWLYEFENGNLVLKMVKFIETAKIQQDVYTVTEETRYRVLRIEDGLYVQEVYSVEGDLIERYEPTKADGSRWDRIPFHFLGAIDNLPDIDEAPISGIVDLNIAHYQVTADKRKNLHIHCGGLLVVSSSMSVDEWQAANPNGVTVGADHGLFVGEGGSAQLLQLNAASAAQTEIESLEMQMIAVGARMITDGTQNQTAEAARIDASAESSTLSNIVGNASEGIEAALEDCCEFAGADPAQVSFVMNTEFFDNKLTPQEIMAMIQLGDRQLMANTDQMNMLRRGGWLAHDRSNEDVLAEVEIQPVPGL